MGSKIGFEMSLIIVETIRGRCASFMSLSATVSEICDGQTPPYMLVVYMSRVWRERVQGTARLAKHPDGGCRH